MRANAGSARTALRSAFRCPVCRRMSHKFVVSEDLRRLLLVDASDAQRVDDERFMSEYRGELPPPADPTDREIFAAHAIEDSAVLSDLPEEASPAVRQFLIDMLSMSEPADADDVLNMMWRTQSPSHTISSDEDGNASAPLNDAPSSRPEATSQNVMSPEPSAAHNATSSLPPPHRRRSFLRYQVYHRRTPSAHVRRILFPDTEPEEFAAAGGSPGGSAPTTPDGGSAPASFEVRGGAERHLVAGARGAAERHLERHLVATEPLDSSAVEQLSLANQIADIELRIPRDLRQWTMSAYNSDVLWYKYHRELMPARLHSAFCAHMEQRGVFCRRVADGYRLTLHVRNRDLFLRT